MDMVGIILIGTIVVWGGFIMYLLVHHPETAFKIQDRIREEQRHYEAKLGKAGNRAAKVAVSALNRALK